MEEINQEIGTLLEDALRKLPPQCGKAETQRGVAEEGGEAGAVV